MNIDRWNNGYGIMKHVFMEDMMDYISFYFCSECRNWNHTKNNSNLNHILYNIYTLADAVAWLMCLFSLLIFLTLADY